MHGKILPSLHKFDTKNYLKITLYDILKLGHRVMKYILKIVSVLIASRKLSNSMKQNPFYKRLVLQLVKQFSKFYGTGKFMSMFTRFT